LSLALTLVIGLIIVVALFRLGFGVVTGLLLVRSTRLTVFGETLTSLIALEFNHMLQYVAKREQSIIQPRSCC
jgi:hypothetical protein